MPEDSTQQHTQRTIRAAKRRARIQERGRHYRQDQVGNGEVQYRISRSLGRRMFVGAMFFDALPLLTIIAVLALGAMLFTDSTVGGYAAKACADAASSKTSVGIGINALGCAGGGLIAGLGGTVFLVTIGPIIYMIMSVVSFFIGMLILTMVFATRGVRPTHGRLLASVVVEAFPLTNWLPGMTWYAWSQTHLSRKQDERKARHA